MDAPLELQGEALQPDALAIQLPSSSQGGDMYEEHQRMLSDIAGYDNGIGGCTLQQHEDWIKSLKCKVIRLDGTNTLDRNLKIIIDTYKNR